MEIKIDTKKDSVDDIKKMIEFLSKFIGESADNVPSAGDLPSGAFNMFDNPPGSDVSPPSDPDDDEMPQIEPY